MMPSISWPVARDQLVSAGKFRPDSLITVKVKDSKRAGFVLYKEEGKLLGKSGDGSLGWLFGQGDTVDDVIEELSALVEELSERKVYQLQVVVSTKNEKRDYTKTITITPDESGEFSRDSTEQSIVGLTLKALVDSRAYAEDERRDIREARAELERARRELFATQSSVVKTLEARVAADTTENKRLHDELRDARRQLREYETGATSPELIRAAGEALNSPAGMAVLATMGGVMSGGADGAVMSQGDLKVAGIGALKAAGEALTQFARDSTFGPKGQLPDGANQQ